MADGQVNTVIRYIRKLAMPADAEDAGDGQLLERFITQRDEAAYEAILRRHGPMVLGTCLRALNNLHDAEDAFQATFLVLARKAGSISRRESVGGWLYRIAYRTAMRAKMEASRRYARQSPLEDTPATDSVPDLAWFELRPVLDEELNRLPERYRDAVVLCYFQDQTYAQAAKALGLPEGTISSRLARARDLLRKRLVRRGLTLSSGLLATLLSQNALSAAMPVAWVNSLAKAALQFTMGKAVAGAVSGPVAALTEGVLQAMFMTKLRILAIVLLTLGLLGTSAGVLAHQVLGEKQANVQKEDPPTPSPKGGKQFQEEKAPKAKRFENEFGYSWSFAPQEFGCPLPGSYSLWAKDGVICTFAQGKQGELIITLGYARLAEKPYLRYRPVLFDAERKRYLPCQPVAGGTSNDGTSLSMMLFTSGCTPLPAEKVRYLGIEVLTPEGIKAIVARARERAKAAGIEVLPPAFVGEAYDFTLTTLLGKKVRAADLRGKVVLIDCWSTTCSPCMAKMPKLKSLYEKYHKQGFEIIGVSLDDNAKKVEKVCQLQGLTWPQVLVPPDEKTREIWYQAAGLESVPRLLLIDRQGILRAECGPDQLGEEITKLMEAPK